MTDRPILFSAPMVRALLAGRKTQTRRVLTPPRGFVDEADPNHWNVSYWNSSGISFVCWPQDEAVTRKVPHRFAIGDRLWVRENISMMPRTAYALPKTLSPTDPDEAAYYQADFDRSGKPRWRPSIHMPRWASRLTLTVTDVRVQRLQDISEEDAIAEGVARIGAEYITQGSKAWDAGPNFYTVDCGSGSLNASTAVEVYRILWDHLNNGRGFGWDANPWIVAVTFTVEQRNIDRGA